MTAKYIFFLFLFLNSSVLLFGQDSREKCLELLEQGINFNKQKEYPEAIATFSKVEAMSKRNKWPDILWATYDNLGGSYKALSSYGEALGYYTKALSIIENNPDIPFQKKVVTLNNFAGLYSGMGETKKALDIYLKAYKLIDGKKFFYEQKSIKVNIANNYNDLGEHKKALTALLDVKDIQTKPFAMNFWKATYAETLFYLGEVERAKKLAQELLPETSQRDKKGICNICVLELLSKIAVSQNRLDEAVHFAEEALGLTYKNEWRLRIERYNRLSEIYKKKGKPEMALTYMDSTLLAKDSLSQQINHQLLQVNKVKFKVQNYQNQLKINKERYESKMLIMWIVIVLGLCLSIFVYAWQKNRIIKHRQEKEIAANKQKIVKLELQELQNDVAEKNRKLSTKALYFSGRNELIEEMMRSLEQVPEVMKNPKVAQYIKTLKRYLKTDAEWDKFIAHFEKVNPNFIKKLKSEHPKLSSHDIRFLCYLYMNLDIKEMSIIFSITEEAARKRKQRIAKKMGLDTDELHQYILTLS